MRWHAIATCLAVLTLLSGCRIDLGGRVLSAAETFEETVPVAGTEAYLKLTNVNGRVDVSTWDRNEIHIEAEKFASSERRLADIDIQIRETSCGVEVRTRYDKGRSLLWKGKVDYRVTVPARAGVNVKTVNGRLVLRGIGGRQKLKTVNGSVRIEGARSEVVAATVNGSIEAGYDELDGSGRNELTSVNGSVRLGLFEGASGEFEVRTINGRIRSEFDELEPTGRWGRKTLAGQLGGGGSVFAIKTVNGSVRIEKRAAGLRSTELEPMASARR